MFIYFGLHASRGKLGACMECVSELLEAVENIINYTAAAARLSVRWLPPAIINFAG